MNLKDYLQSNGIKGVWFAKQLGVNYTTLHFIKHGARATEEMATRIESLTKGAVTKEELMQCTIPKPQKQDQYTLSKTEEQEQYV